MNRSTLPAAPAARFASFRSKAGAVVVGTLGAASSAFAQVAAPNTGDITDAITTYSTAAVAVIVAFALGVWAMRAAGLLGRR